MSAHRIYCYAPQRIAVLAAMGELGAIVSRDSPHSIHDAYQLRGLDHITFIVIDGHACKIPHDLWKAIERQGAIVIHVDDHFRRGILPVRHIPGEARELAEQGCE